MIKTLPILIGLMSSVPALAQTSDATRGEYVLAMAGCVACHTVPKDGAFLAGGRELKTDFGSFFTPNITPDPETGIGDWSDEDFVRALREGVSPDGGNYYPTFPYTSYTRMTRADMLDLKAYLDSVPAVRNPVPDHDLPFPFGVRASVIGWQLQFFDDAPFAPDPNQSDAWNRGAYIVNGPGHCGECHTPRNVMGAMDRSRELSGNPEGPGGKIPDLSPANKKGVVTWSRDDVLEYLSSGMTPEGDFAGGEMAEVIDHSTGILTESDRTAIAVFVKTLK